MNFLQPERAALERLLPGLDEALAGVPLRELERPGSPGIALFRSHNGPGLLIPAAHGGHGASALEALRVQQALAVRSPSLAVATTMHHFSVATLVEMARSPAATGMEWLALEGIARQKLYVASGFAEGRSGASIFSSTFRVRRTSEGLVLRGSKKPCSLSASMDLLTVSFVLAGEGRSDSLVVALLPAATPGVSRRAFWSADALAGAESEEVVLEDVVVPEGLLSYAGSPGQLDAVAERGFLWFELLITASYLGASSALVERVLRQGRGTEGERVGLAILVEGGRTALEGLARALDAGERGPDLLARALLVRYAVQEAGMQAASRAAELLGGLAFIGGPDVGLLLASARALAFHPPSRLAASPGLDDWLRGGAFRID